MIFLLYACSTMCLSVGLGTGGGDVWREGWSDSWRDPPLKLTLTYTHTNTALQLCVKVTVVWGETAGVANNPVSRGDRRNSSSVRTVLKNNTFYKNTVSAFSLTDWSALKKKKTT